MCVDTRSPSDISWFPALAAFRVAWAEGHRARLFVDLVGNVPACFQRRSFWWHKVFVGNRLLRCRRLKLLLWMDTDSTIVPEKDANQHRERSVALTFPSLQELWDRALALRRGVPADGGEPASGGEPKGKPARGGGPCLIGYHDRSGFNAGVWLVAGGDGVLYARMQVLFVGFRGPCPAGPCPAGPGPGPPGPGPPSPGSPGFGPPGPGPGPPGRGPGRPRPRPARRSTNGTIVSCIGDRRIEAGGQLGACLLRGSLTTPATGGRLRGRTSRQVSSSSSLTSTWWLDLAWRWCRRRSFAPGGLRALPRLSIFMAIVSSRGRPPSPASLCRRVPRSAGSRESWSLTLLRGCARSRRERRARRPKTSGGRAPIAAMARGVRWASPWCTRASSTRV